MNMGLRILGALAVIALCYWAVVEVGKDPEVDSSPASDEFKMPENLPETPLELVSSEQCAACHEEIYNEWRASHHWFSWQNPEPRRKGLSNNFQNKDCIPCHAPRPMLEVGFGKRPLEREDRREDGVNCFTCHKFGNAILTPNALTAAATGAPCQPVTWQPLADMTLCAPCHDQHKVKQDWLLSRFAVAGDNYQDCNDCHMAPKPGPPTKGSAKTTHRSHGWEAGHDPDMLRRSATLRAQRLAQGESMTAAIRALTDREFDGAAAPSTDRRVLIEVTNSGVGHNLPADERHRAVDLVVRFVPASGAAPKELQLTRFRNPYRDEFELLNPFKDRAGEILVENLEFAGQSLELAQVRLLPLFNPDRKVFYKESTQLAAGETRLVWFEMPELGPGRLEISLYYKLQPFLSNNDAVKMASLELQF